MTPDPDDINDVRADDAIVEDLRAGNTPDSQLGEILGAWRDDCAR